MQRGLFDQLADEVAGPGAAVAALVAPASSVLPLAVPGCQVASCTRAYGVALYVPGHGQAKLCHIHGRADNAHELAAAALQRGAVLDPGPRTEALACPERPVAGGLHAGACDDCGTRPWATVRPPRLDLKAPTPWPRVCWSCCSRRTAAEFPPRPRTENRLPWWAEIFRDKWPAASRAFAQRLHAHAVRGGASVAAAWRQVVDLLGLAGCDDAAGFFVRGDEGRLAELEEALLERGVA